MGIRKIEFVESEYYHIFNRGVDKRNIFEDKGDMYYFFNRLVDLNIIESSFSSNTQRKKNLVKL